MQTYQNLTNQELIIPNIGVVAPNGTIKTETSLDNPNLKLITKDEARLSDSPNTIVAPPVQTAPEPPQPPSEQPEGAK